MVEGLCRGLLRDRAEAEDAAQQTFLSAHRALLNGSEPREPAAWLAAIARNECLARVRKRMREPLPAELDGAAASAGDPLSAVIERADLDAVWRAVSELPKQQRKALLLREFGGLGYDELAVALGVSTPAVESLLFRARTRIRGRLETVFATVGSAGWISLLQDAVARLLASGDAARLAAPVAAKAVGVTLGAAAVAGGAVAGERHVRAHHPERHAPPAIVTRSEPPAPAAPVATGTSSHESRRARRGGDEGSHSSGHGASGGSSGHRGADDRGAETQSGRSSRDSSGGPGPSVPAASSSGHGGEDHGGGSGSSSESTSGGGETAGGSGEGPGDSVATVSTSGSGSSGDDGHDGSDDGGAEHADEKGK